MKPVEETAALRDIPASCNCCWTWTPGTDAWRRTTKNPACPWHTQKETHVLA